MLHTLCIDFIQTVLQTWIPYAKQAILVDLSTSEMKQQTSVIMCSDAANIFDARQLNKMESYFSVLLTENFWFEIRADNGSFSLTH